MDNEKEKLHDIFVGISRVPLGEEDEFTDTFLKTHTVIEWHEWEDGGENWGESKEDIMYITRATGLVEHFPYGQDRIYWAYAPQFPRKEETK